jgi:hypothetical protein
VAAVEVTPAVTEQWHLLVRVVAVVWEMETETLLLADQALMVATAAMDNKPTIRLVVAVAAILPMALMLLV